MELEIRLPADSKNIETRRKLHCSNLSDDLLCFFSAVENTAENTSIINTVFVVFSV